MKLIASLVIAASLVLGLIASVTAYVPRIDAIDPHRETLTLNAPAGQDPDDPTKPLIMPVDEDGEEVMLTAATLEQLKDAGVERVRVKEFGVGGWRRWDGLWLFVPAAIGLFIGAMMMRSVARKELAATAMAQDTPTTDAPEQLIDTAYKELTALRAELADMTDPEAKIRRILAALDRVHDHYFDPFVSARPVLVGRLGMTGYAQLMDKFAASERQFNRAWSAAADGVIDESETSLDNGVALLEETRQRLDSTSS